MLKDKEPDNLLLSLPSLSAAHGQGMIAVYLAIPAKYLLRHVATTMLKRIKQEWPIIYQESLPQLKAAYGCVNRKMSASIAMNVVSALLDEAVK